MHISALTLKTLKLPPQVPNRAQANSGFSETREDCWMELADSRCFCWTVRVKTRHSGRQTASEHCITACTTSAEMLLRWRPGWISKDSAGADERYTPFAKAFIFWVLTACQPFVRYEQNFLHNIPSSLHCLSSALLNIPFFSSRCLTQFSRKSAGGLNLLPVSI